MTTIISRAKFDRIRALLDDGNLKAVEIADRYGVSALTVRKIASGWHCYQRPPGQKQPREVYVPSEAEIESACRGFRERKREESIAWTVPECERPAY